MAAHNVKALEAMFRAAMKMGAYRWQHAGPLPVRVIARPAISIIRVGNMGDAIDDAVIPILNEAVYRNPDMVIPVDENQIRRIRAFMGHAPEQSETAMGKRLSDDPGLAEMKRMEALAQKAPCIARLAELAAYAAKDNDG